MSAIPFPALAIGLLGLVPFVAGALLAIALGDTFGERLLVNYGAVILSFMAGIHWGLAMSRHQHDWRALGYSAVPPGLALLAFVIGGTSGLVILAASFSLLLAYDLHEGRKGHTPAWYPILRWPLTIIVCSCLLLTALMGPA